MTLHQKLLDVKKQVEYMKKDSEGFGYKYVKSSQVLLTMRDRLNKAGILLESRILKTNKERFTYTNNKGKEKSEFITELWMLMTWVNANDPSERIDIDWYCQGTDDFEKGVGKALTYGEKYFLLKQFNIPTDDSDPDVIHDRLRRSTTTNDPPEKIDDKTATRFKAAIKKKGIDQAVFERRIKMELGAGSIDDILEPDIEKAMGIVKKLGNKKEQ